MNEYFYILITPTALEAYIKITHIFELSKFSFLPLPLPLSFSSDHTLFLGAQNPLENEVKVMNECNQCEGDTTTIPLTININPIYLSCYHSQHTSTTKQSISVTLLLLIQGGRIFQLKNIEI